ncbi:hypothetical protein C7974DRAFT_448771 [Boeremia exigua]|uniref:uncharacterized protein n=1 Tax=Boeremia exigua TaxID=749465 RepID=UPI001E8D4495|nr:uncharacterized protein C7974DRAFT_448771 [Boeremia exigua]KAH6638975.1 hypothetical protein C7974DRAFT_448771 [Boeremia exigua]
MADESTKKSLAEQWRERELAQAQECLDIIEFKQSGQIYHNRQGARVKPNHRLVEVFGIKNVFTDEHPGGFSRETTSKIRAACKMRASDDKGSWTNLRKRSIECFDEYIKHVGQHGTINIAELAQFVTLKLSLSYLFADAEIAFKTADTFDDITFIGHQINKLWIDSKKPDDMPGSLPPYLNDNSNEPTVPGRNPLNFLLPAYETMWRVVLRCFIEVRLRDAANGAEWRLVLANYLEHLRDPACMPHAFQESSETSVRPIDIAKEALRLYPPSRHVHRDFDGELFRADIEACHRSRLLGGDDPLVFRPERWESMRHDDRDMMFGEMGTQIDTHALKLSEMRRGFMPFASHCTADKRDTRGFAMKMIVMLVAVLCDGLGNKWTLANAGSLPERHIPLDSDRAAYEGLSLRSA